MHSAPRPSPWMVILAFGLVYLFWGSTYLAIDIGVQTIPPALLCAVRFSIAGVVMLVVCALTGHKVLYSPRQIALAAVVGLLLLMGGNLTLCYSELTVSSGLAALIIAITPLWFLVLDSLLLGHHHISGRGKAGLALGILGLFVLFYPELTSRTTLGHRELWASLSLIGGSFSWALGSVLSKRWQSGMDVFSFTGWQVLAAGVGKVPYARGQHLPAGEAEHVHARLPALRQHGAQCPGERSADQAQRRPQLAVPQRGSRSEFRIKKNEQPENAQRQPRFATPGNVMVAQQQRIEHQKPQRSDGDNQRSQSG